MVQPGLRKTVLTIFCAYMGFIVAGLALYGMVDDSLFLPAMNSHLDLALAWYAIAGGSALALAGALIAGLPIGYAAIARALKARRGDIFLLLAVPLLALLAVAGYVVVLALVTNRLFGDGAGQLSVPTQLGAPVIVGFALFVIVAAIASAGAVCAAVLRSDADETVIKAKGITVSVRPYEFALLPGAVTTLAMLLMLAATVAWGLLARGIVPRAFDEETGLFMPVQAGITWVLVVVVMAVCCAVAVAALARGYRLSRNSHASAS